MKKLGDADWTNSSIGAAYRPKVDGEARQLLSYIGPEHSPLPFSQQRHVKTYATNEILSDRPNCTAGCFCARTRTPPELFLKVLDQFRAYRLELGAPSTRHAARVSAANDQFIAAAA